MLTRKQNELLRFIHGRLQESGVPPSFDEMKEALDLKSKSGIHRLITALEERGIGFRSLTESMDTTTSGGRLIFHVFGALAEFERAVIRERTLAGLAAARARGRCGGRPKLMNATQIAMAKAMLANREMPVRQVYEALHVSRATLYRHLNADRVASGERPTQRPRGRAVPRRPRLETPA